MPGIVIVTFNSAEVIEGCLKACVDVPGSDVIVVDNASADDTVSRVRRWPQVKVLANRTNRGFGAAVNQGIAALEQEAVLILNPDATPLCGIELLETTVTGGSVGAATGRLLGADGAKQEGFNVRALPTPALLAFEAMGLNRLWPSNPLNRRYRHPSPQSQTDVEQPAGAFLMIRRRVWEEIGGFDERFFPVWFEDVDFCKRVLEHGYRIVYVPEAAARHQGGHSAAKLSWRDRQLFWYGSLLKYASKHFSGASRAIVSAAVVLACFPRAIGAAGRVGVSEAVSVYTRVIWLAGQCLRLGERGRSTPALSQPSKEQLKQSR